MDQTLLRSYFATVYEFPTHSGTLRASLDGEIVQDHSALPDLLTRRFAVLTAYNPRSMLLPRRVNEQRHFVLRDLLILGCYRVEPCVGSGARPGGGGGGAGGPRATRGGGSRRTSCTAWSGRRRSASAGCSARTPFFTRRTGGPS